MLRTVREVEMHDELTVGYVELYASTGERRARLLKSKGTYCISQILTLFYRSW